MTAVVAAMSRSSGCGARFSRVDDADRLTAVAPSLSATSPVPPRGRRPSGQAGDPRICQPAQQMNEAAGVNDVRIPDCHLRQTLLAAAWSARYFVSDYDGCAVIATAGVVSDSAATVMRPYHRPADARAIPRTGGG